MVAYSRSQHWTVGGFRITVMHYKTLSGECAICGRSPARHAVWADGRGEREDFRGDQAHFCDEHRPERGSLPPLDYIRLLSGVPDGVITYERTEPWPGRRCSRCGQPPVLWYQHQCLDCDAPEAYYATTRVPTGERARHHLHHTVFEEYRCAEHALDLPGALAAAGRPDLTTVEPGDPIPPERTGGMTGLVVGECGHRVAGSEWAAGFRNCERCGG